jgi:hypothetical protein
VINLLDDVMPHFGALLYPEPCLKRRLRKASGPDQPPILNVALYVALIMITPLAQSDFYLCCHSLISIILNDFQNSILPLTLTKLRLKPIHRIS